MMQQDKRNEAADALHREHTPSHLTPPTRHQLHTVPQHNNRSQAKRSHSDVTTTPPSAMNPSKHD